MKSLFHGYFIESKEIDKLHKLFKQILRLC